MRCPYHAQHDPSCYECMMWLKMLLTKSYPPSARQHTQCPNCHYPRGACQCGAPQNAQQQFYQNYCPWCSQPSGQCMCNWAPGHIPGRAVPTPPQAQPSAVNQRLATHEMVEELNQKIDAIAASLATLIETLSLDESKLALLKLLKEIK